MEVRRNRSLRSCFPLSTETLLDCFRVFVHGLVGEADEDRNSDNQRQAHRNRVRLTRRLGRLMFERSWFSSLSIASTRVGLEPSPRIGVRHSLHQFADFRFRYSFATISAFTASRTAPPHAAIAWSAATSSRSVSACGLGAALRDMDGSELTGRSKCSHFVLVESGAPKYRLRPQPKSCQPRNQALPHHQKLPDGQVGDSYDGGAERRGRATA